jgi:hypothetical protein
MMRTWYHNCAAYVDVTGNKPAEKYCQHCASSLGWQYQRLEGNPALLKDLINGNCSSDRFLVIEPGEAIVGTTDGTLIKAEVQG